jgi:predicted dehydrogenase
MGKMRWGLLSTANINRRVIPAIRESKRGKLAAVASRDHNKAQAYAKKWEIPLAFGSYQAMLDSGEIDVVYISLPNHLHSEWSIKAMESGVHVLCEKPFAISLDQVDAMIEASQKTGMILTEAFMYRHHPQTKIVGEMVKSGKMGEITLIRGAFDFILKNRENVRLVPEWGGGCLWDLGVYPLSFAQYIMNNPPDWVLGTQLVGDTGVDEVFVGQMGYSELRFAQISSSFRTPFYTFMEVIGTEGRLYISMPFIGVNDSEMTFFPNQRDPVSIQVPYKSLYLGEIEDIHTAILDNESNLLTLKETRNHIRTVLALYESARSGEIYHIKGNT